jgi:hypothetical protein
MTDPHLSMVLAEVLYAGITLDGRGSSLNDNGQRLVLASAGVVYGSLPVQRGTEEAPLHVPHALVLVWRIEGARKLCQPAGAAVQLNAGR